jgi:hypothetical protein
MRVKPLFALTALFYLASCSSDGRMAGSYIFPDSVMADRVSFGVARASPSSFMLNMKFAISATGEEEKPQAPPTDEQWRKAAEQALPPGCKIDEIKPSDGGEAKVTFSC